MSDERRATERRREADGKKVGVLLDIEEYERVLAELEELESIRAFDQAVREIEQELC